MGGPKHSAHVVIFPFPAQGHVNSMLKLAELLCLLAPQLHVTFIVSDYVHTRLLRYSDIESRFKTYSRFKFQILPHVYHDNPHTQDSILTLFHSVRTSGEPLLRELLLRCRGRSDVTTPPVSCLIVDAIMGFALDTADELGLPTIYFRTISACAFWAYFCTPRLIEAGELPFKECDMDAPVANVKGMESFLRFRDLPSFCRVRDMSNPSTSMVITETQRTSSAKALIFNTFEDLEGPILAQIRTCIPNVYTIGPLHSHLKSRKAAKSSSTVLSSNSLWEEDTDCIQWLDQQPPKSVIYVSFGSTTVMTRQQLLEFWHGIVNSGTRFLWVIRPESIGDKAQLEGQIPEELEEATKERGHMVGWAPQEMVLSHPAIGGFFTHSGWNSTLESIVEGVPMICWSYFADQQVNSRFAEEVWKLGLDIKDTCDRAIVEKAVREVMELRKDEFLERASRMAKLARDSINEGGSSRRNLDSLIQYITSTAIPL